MSVSYSPSVGRWAKKLDSASTLVDARWLARRLAVG